MKLELGSNERFYAIRSDQATYMGDYLKEAGMIPRPVGLFGIIGKERRVLLSRDMN